MRRKWMGIVVLGLVTAAPAWSDNNAGKAAKPDAAPKMTAGARNAPAGSNTAKSEATPPASEESAAVRLELQQLKELILDQARELEAQRAAMREQQQKLEALTAELRTTRSMSSVAASVPAAAGSAEHPSVSLEAVAASQQELGTKVGQIEKDIAEAKGRIKGFGPFGFSGDLRVRYEPAFSGNAVTLPEGVGQHRERFRLRLNANAKFNEEFSGGFSLASGDLNNPLSTNQSLTTFYIRKPIGIDKAFVTYQPQWYKPLSVTAGKFGYTWYRTELMWDNDLNPEGLSESAHWNWKDSFLQHLGVVAIQSPLNSSFSGGGNVTTPTPSSAMFGGQLQANLKLHDRVKFGAYSAFYHFRNPDQIAQNQVGGAGPTSGALAGNNITNFIGTVGTGPAARRFFASRFDVLDVTARFDFDTHISRFPLMALVNFAQNTGACGNMDVFSSLPPGTVSCDPRQRHAHWYEAQLGRTQEQGDARFGYTFIRIERDAVPSAFNFDDKRQATNVAQHRLELFYQAYRNITLGFTGLIGRQLVTATSAQERWLRRFQFDLIYKF